ncbi:hypothetical protein ACFWFI_03820 [Streptomyces sp. NPDC060209]|uniref:hypothetical protein n=1 Tax=Streptomyces sp. NPDC060209 TaxID=3347073 RepID=UPI003665F268
MNSLAALRLIRAARPDGLVKVPAADFAKYTLVGRTAEYHRKQIREALGFRPSTVASERALAEWLAVEVCPVELVEDR